MGHERKIYFVIFLEFLTELQIGEALIQNMSKHARKVEKFGSVKNQSSQKMLSTDNKISTNITKSQIFEHIQRTYSHNIKNTIYLRNDDISNSLRIGFMFLLCVTIIVILFILYKTCRMYIIRLGNKYGTQREHTDQEMMPLPIATDDNHSDDDDRTLFDIQRKQLRML